MTTGTQVTEAAKTIDQALALKGNKAIKFWSDKDSVQPLIDFVVSEADAQVPDVTTDKGRKAIGTNARAISSSKTLLVDAIDASTKAAQLIVDNGKAVKKHVGETLDAKRKEVLKPRDDWKEEQALLEQERVDGIRDRITNIGAIATLQGTESKEELAGIIDALEAMDVSEGFEEFTQEAMKVKQEAIGTIHTAVNVLVQKEIDEQARIEREQEQAELAAEQKRLRIGERIMKLQQIPMTMFQSTAEEVSDKIHSLNTHQPTVEDFEDRHGEAMTAFNGVIANLDMLLQQKQQAEEAQRIIDEAAEKKLAEEAAAQEPVQEPVQEPQPSDTLERLPVEDNAPFMLDEEDEAVFNDVVADAKPEPQDPQPSSFDLAQSDLVVLAGLTHEQAEQVIKQIQQGNVNGLSASF